MLSSKCLGAKVSEEHVYYGGIATRDIMECMVARWVLQVEHPYIRSPARYRR